MSINAESISSYRTMLSEIGNLLKAQGLVAGYAGKPAQDD
jgi:hypothetical protein